MKTHLWLISGFLLIYIATAAQPPGDIPEARHGHTMVTLPDGTVMLFGGEDVSGHLFNDIYTFDNAWNEVEPTGEHPPKRKNHAAWFEDQEMYIHGGEGEVDLLDDTWRYNIETNAWDQVEQSGDVPSPRYGHTVISVGDNDYLYGGKDNSGSDLMDFYSYDPATGQWEEDNGMHPPSTGHAIGVAGERIYAYGGIRWNETDYRDDARYYDTPLGSDWMFSYTSGDIPSPLAFMCHTFAQFGNDMLMYMFGGENAEKGLTDDFYQFDMETTEWTKLPDGPPSTSHGAIALTWQSKDNPTLLLFGGLNETGEPTDQQWMYDFNAGEWNMITGIDPRETTGTNTHVMLQPNYPNPFSNKTTIAFSLPRSSNVELVIFNDLGQKVKTLTNKFYQQGTHKLSWTRRNDNGETLPPGMYIYSLKVDDQTLVTRKCVSINN
ncbi:MAG: T9SS type A sorting domain-containing protein [Bacteroidales bacterium]|nr:T9SS type A sorting domain-containing protein [Bacteroidales bacterium]